jgi:uncharacterized protein
MIVVSDTSPIRALSHLGMLGILETLFGEVIIPPAVVDELENPRSQLPVISLKPFPFVRVQPPADQKLVASLKRHLDRGESEAIVLATELKAEFLLIDERDGRLAAATRGLVPLGVIGVLVRAKKHGRVEAVRPLVKRLQDEARFFVHSHVLDDALRPVGE